MHICEKIVFYYNSIFLMEKVNPKKFSLKVYLLALIICVLMAGMISSFPNSH